MVNDTVSTSAQRRASRTITIMQVLVVLGLVARFAIWLASEGSNDARAWKSFAREINIHGIIGEYVANSRFNHPPLMGVWAVAALKVSTVLRLPYALIFKLLPLTAELLALPLIMHALRRRGASLVVQWQGVAVFSTALVCILVSGYHGNTDSMCALLVLLAVVLVDDGEHPFLAGLAFAAALNVKLIPLVLAPALFIMQARTLRHAVLFMLALGIGVIPFLPPILEVGPTFYKNAIAYNSSPNRWGIHYLLFAGMHFKALAAPLHAIDVFWAAAARYVILLSSFALAVRGRRLGLPAKDVAAAAMCVFLILAPGIGVQYFCYPLALMILVDRRHALLYGLASGLFIGAIYISFSPLVLPLQSHHGAPFGEVPGLIGIPAWCLLTAFLVAHLRRRPVVAAGVATVGFVDVVDPVEVSAIDPVADDTAVSLSENEARHAEP